MKNGMYTSEVIGNLKAGGKLLQSCRTSLGEFEVWEIRCPAAHSLKVCIGKDYASVQAFSSNELAFLSMLFFGVGLYGNLQCLVLPGPT